MKKEIWLPASETKVTVDSDGKLRVWEEMVMSLKPLGTKPTGFKDKPTAQE
jgi:hypothetical protein